MCHHHPASNILITFLYVCCLCWDVGMSMWIQLFIQVRALHHLGQLSEEAVICLKWVPAAYLILWKVAHPLSPWTISPDAWLIDYFLKFKINCSNFLKRFVANRIYKYHTDVFLNLKMSSNKIKQWIIDENNIRCINWKGKFVSIF